MPEPDPRSKKQTWRFASLKNLRPAPRSFLCHPEPHAIGSFGRGEQLLAGVFVFAGLQVVAEAASFWNISPPSGTFLDELHSFGWLEDLAALGGKAARKQAQSWLLEWIDAFGQGTGIGWEPDLAGRRVIHWTTHAMFLLKGLSPKDSNKVFKSLGRHVNFLSNNWKTTPRGQAKFKALAGMAYAGLVLEGCEYALRPALKGLEEECSGWLGAEGAIPPRNPEELSEIFTLLTWVAKLLEDTGHPVDPALTDAFGRLAPGLRSLRFHNGDLARFHGGGRGAEGQLDQSLADAGLRNSAALHSFMGYERLSAGRIVVIMDGAKPPAGPLAHASMLGFEMASGRHPMLVNCGPGARLGGVWHKACALAAAHNVLTIEGVGAATAEIRTERAQDPESTWLSATSHGFAGAFGLLHERRLLVSTDGRHFSGEDRIYPQTPPDAATHPAEVICRPAQGHSYMLHFHLHPDVAVAREEQGATLTLPNGEVWQFRQEGGVTSLADSVMLDRSYTIPRATKQIVVAGRSIDYVGAIRWSFTRL